MNQAHSGAMMLHGRTALVTGAGRGIGAATAALFARCGSAVAICDRDPAGLAETERALDGMGATVLAGKFDVRDTGAARAFVGAVARRFGQVDVLVNNAAATFHAPFMELTERAESELIAENFTQVAQLVRSVVGLMPAGSSVVNVTSSDAHQAAPGFALSAAMKAAVTNLTRSLALELAPQRIRVNAIAPDALPTEGEQSARQEVHTRGAGYEPVRLPPMGFLGTPEDAAGAALFLASDLARFVTGTTVHVDGGIWAAGGWRRAE